LQKDSVVGHSYYMANTRDPLSLRLPPEFHLRLQNVSARLGVAKHTFAQAAITAAVEAVERDAGLVFPIEFVVRRIPASRTARKAK
jgi:predicted DNA-binding protein